MVSTILIETIKIKVSSGNIYCFKLCLYKAPRSFHLVKSTKQCESALFLNHLTVKLHVNT